MTRKLDAVCSLKLSNKSYNKMSQPISVKVVRSRKLDLRQK